MVYPNELRLGNKVQVNNPGNDPQICEVVYILTDEVRVENSAGPNFTVPIKNVSGIPLDQDKVKNCGFHIQSGSSKSYIKSPVTIINDSEGWHMTLNEWHIGRNFHFLHQLQNLYFALCLEELPVKD